MPSQAAKEAFLSEPRIGILSIGRDANAPLTAPIWYRYTPGGSLRFMIGKDSRKARLLQVGTPVSLCAQRDTPPYAYVTVEGPVIAIEPGAPAQTEELAIHYLGEQDGKAYAQQLASQGPPGSSRLVTVRPETWLAVDYARQ